MLKGKKILSEKVVPVEVAQGSVSQLISKIANTGFQGRTLAEVCDIFKKMVKDPLLTIFFGYSGALSVAGQWKIINWLLENRFIDVLVSTGANISEDIVDAMGFHYWKKSSVTEDNLLFDHGINRYYDLYGQESDYIKMTDLIADFIVTLDENHTYSSREFLLSFGKWLGQKNIRSIVTTAAEHGVPIFCPAIVDSAFGDAALIARSRGHHLTIDAVKDYVEFMKISNMVKETGVIYIGGGVPKDFIQLLAVTGSLLHEDRKVPNRKNSMDRKATGEKEAYHPHKYAIQITADAPQWGGLSGCSFEEAISWGKETKKSNFAQCFCDATIALPIVAHYLCENISGARKGSDLSGL